MQPIDLVRRVAPNARAEYLAAFAAGTLFLSRFALVNRRRFVHFLAQVCHETDGLTIRVESMNYSAARLPQVWPSRFRDPAVARAHAHDPETLANFVYADRMGNGPAASGDGWRFIGRGMLQITGREAYEKYGRLLGIDLVGNPDLAVSPAWSLAIAAAEWASSKRKGKTCNQMADADDVEGITLAINGGLIGFGSRKEWLTKIARALGDESLDLPPPSFAVAIGEKPVATITVAATGLAVVVGTATVATTPSPPPGTIMAERDDPAPKPLPLFEIGLGVAAVVFVAALVAILRRPTGMTKE